MDFSAKVLLAPKCVLNAVVFHTIRKQKSTKIAQNDQQVGENICLLSGRFEVFQMILTEFGL